MTGVVLITGGAGFIGCNLADRLAREGHRVRVLDDLSRGGAEHNLAWLHATHGPRVESLLGDVRDRACVREAVAGVDAVFHLAAQVAVTTSLVDPLHDLGVNARGTVEVLEAARAAPTPPAIVFTSTNKVYGCLDDVPLTARGARWVPADPTIAVHGIDERRPLELRTPYGCSKGAADQYVLDYARTFGLPATVFRMSCIYGPHQRGTEDQGWVAHFLIRAIAGEPITIYGDGRQVRDVLFVDDLVEAMWRAWQAIDRVRGHAFNVGGGPTHTLSLLELIAMIEALTGRAPRLAHGDVRPGDQRYYVSDPRALGVATGWRPRVSPHDGVAALYRWLVAHRGPGERVPDAGTDAPGLEAIDA